MLPRETITAQSIGDGQYPRTRWWATPTITSPGIRKAMWHRTIPPPTTSSPTERFPQGSPGLWQRLGRWPSPAAGPYRISAVSKNSRGALTAAKSGKSLSGRALPASVPALSGTAGSSARRLPPAWRLLATALSADLPSFPWPYPPAWRPSATALSANVGGSLQSLSLREWKPSTRTPFAPAQASNL